jgi:3-oxoacyl-[acyl-carrier protein] reductase
MSEKRLAIVTGGSRGIGREIVFALARQDRLVVALATNQERLDTLQAQAKDQALDILTATIDVTDSDALDALIKELAEKHGGVGILVNNAGITRDGLMIAMSDEAYDQVLDTNLKAAFVAIRAAARSMIRNRFGRIVNISSVAGVMGNAGQTNYSASKSGLIGLTKSIARELARKNVTANCVAPGFIETDMTADLPEKVKEGVKTTIPMQKLGQSEQIAQAVAYFCSDEACYTTGQVLCVDGGMAM